MTYKKALEDIAERFVGYNFDELTLLEHTILREATVTLSWSVQIKDDKEIYLQKNR